MDRDELIRYLDEDVKMLKDARLKAVFTEVDRKDFLEEDYFPEAYEDYAVPIGHEETLTKPAAAAFMLELLSAQEGERVLNIGAGSGWSTVLLAKLVGEEGYVWSTEIVPELVERSRENIEKYNIDNALVVEAVEGDVLGFPQDVPYDKILLHASVPEVPPELLAQLRVGGVMVIPVADSLVRLERTSEEDIEESSYEGFLFKPLIMTESGGDVSGFGHTSEIDDGGSAGSADSDDDEDDMDDDDGQESVPDYE